MSHLKSGVGVKCVNDGFRLTGPVDNAYRPAFDQIIAKHKIDPATLSLLIPEATVHGVLYDTVDRVKVRVMLVNDLLAAIPTHPEENVIA